jgi:hypothetical protein
MRRALPLALILLLTAGAVQAQASLGRLFNSPQERQQLDRQRGKTPGANGVSVQGAPEVQYSVPGLPPGTPPRMPSEVPADMPSSVPPGMQPGMPPGMPATMPAPPGMPGNGSAGMVDPAYAGNAAGQGTIDAAPAAAPSQLTMNGVLRTSSGRNTVWLNNVPQSGSANKFSNRNRQALTVTLPSGKRVVLQPGQRYDLVDGRVKDISEP